jgi:hypothetical protein
VHACSGPSGPTQTAEASAGRVYGMQNRGRTITFTAVLAITALALTGFTPGRGHGGHGGHGFHGGHGSYGHHSGGGGGCSSSHQDHDSSSSTTGDGYGSGTSDSKTSGYGYDDSYDSSTSSGGTGNRRPAYRSTASPSSDYSGEQLKDAKVKLVSCATKKAPYATVEVTNNNTKTTRFLISVTFVDTDGFAVTKEADEIKVPAKGTTRARVEVGGQGLVDSVDHCETEPYATPLSD